jgi:heat shock protein HslJ
MIIRHKLGLACATGLLLCLTTAAFAVEKKATPPANAEAPAQENPVSSDLPGIEKKFPTKASYELKSINGKPVPNDIIVTLIVDDAFRGSGNGGCNTWSATIYPVRGQRLAVGPVALTRKACDKMRMDIEHAFISILHASPTWNTSGSEMTLKLPQASMVLQRSL